MNTTTNHPADSSNHTSIFQDRPLDNTPDQTAPYSLTAPVEDEGWEFALRFIQVLCLLASMMVFGFGVSSVPRTVKADSGATPAVTVEAVNHHPAPVILPVAACQKTTAHTTATL